MSYQLVQCVLRKPLEEGYRERVSFIPARFAHQGRVLKLREDGVWDDGWQVVSTGGSMVSDEVAETQSLMKRHRQHSDRLRGGA